MRFYILSEINNDNQISPRKKLYVTADILMQCMY